MTNGLVSCFELELELGFSVSFGAVIFLPIGMVYLPELLHQAGLVQKGCMLAKFFELSAAHLEQIKVGKKSVEFLAGNDASGNAMW